MDRLSIRCRVVGVTPVALPKSEGPPAGTAVNRSFAVPSHQQVEPNHQHARGQLKTAHGAAVESTVPSPGLVLAPPTNSAPAFLDLTISNCLYIAPVEGQSCCSSPAGTVICPPKHVLRSPQCVLRLSWRNWGENQLPRTRFCARAARAGGLGPAVSLAIWPGCPISGHAGPPAAQQSRRRPSRWRRRACASGRP